MESEKQQSEYWAKMEMIESGDWILNAALAYILSYACELTDGSMVEASLWREICPTQQSPDWIKEQEDIWIIVAASKSWFG